MEEATKYKKYLKALKEATKKKPKVVKPIKRNLGGASMLKNPGKADLDKDGKLSGYEKKRGMAIEKSMSGKPMKAALGALALGAGVLGLKKFLKNRKKIATSNTANKMPVGDLVEYKKKQIMGAAKGKAVNRREDIRKKQNPISEYDKKGKLKYTAAKMGKSIRGYGAARTSGMGLQDESVKPGKVMMANEGKQASIGYKAPPSPQKKARLESKYKRNVNPMKAERIAEGDRGRRKEFFKRLRKLPKIAGSMVPGSISVAEAKKIKSFLPGKKKVSGRMGGGMMNKPMGYKKGSSIMARGCKLGRKKATKLS